MKRTSKALAYSYLRFSSPQQADGDSIRRQTELRDGWLQRNEVRLDTSVSLKDEGVSGFSGDHRSNPDRHALASFLELVKSGRIPRGSFLIVESLDRLSREHIRPALTLLLNLIDSGIRVVQLLPIETIYDDNVEPMQLMMGIMELSRGHSESKMKSERVSHAWSEKKRQASATGEVLTSVVPGWVRVVDGRFEPIPERVETVRLIYRLAGEGHGIGMIAKRLNAEKVPPMGRADYWARSYIAKILTSRAVFGEYQPHKGRAAPNRKPDGAPIPDYFPTAVTEDEFHAVRAACTIRRNKPGRIGKVVNVFQGLLFDARDGGRLQQANKGKKSAGKTLVSYNATQGLSDTKVVSFPQEVFEQAVLSCLREVEPKDILPLTSKGPDQVMALSGRLVDHDARIEKIKSRLVTGGDIDSLVDVLRTLELEKRALSDQLAGARQAAASPLSEGWGEFRSLKDLMKASDGDGDLRIRLRGSLRRIVESIYCLFMSSGRKRYACVQVFFAGGGASRDYLIAHHPLHKGFQGETAARSKVLSGLVAGKEFDLRNLAAVPKIEKYLLPLLEQASSEGAASETRPSRKRARS